jgi:hypothetical protein
MASETQMTRGNLCDNSLNCSELMAAKQEKVVPFGDRTHV